MGIKLRLAVLALFLTALLQPALAWDATGHMVIAEIAFRRLNPRVKARVLALLGGNESDFLEAACWADDTKSRATAPWHYINLHFRSDGLPDSNQPEAENVVWAIARYQRTLGDLLQPRQDRVEALEYLLHFVGDVHQPLHCADRDTPETPLGDRGGNSFKIKSPVGLAGHPRNLHALWDSGCGLMPRIQRPLLPSGIQDIEALATHLTSLYGEQADSEARSTKPMAWATEGLTLAKSVVYSLDEGVVPSDDYLETGRKVAGRRLVVAGYRLAALLNRVLR